jgi:hypothetical protein
MTHPFPSPFAKADPRLPIRQGAPPLTRPSKEELAAFPAEAQKLLEHNWAAQKSLVKANSPYDLRWVEGRHFLLAGATGPGLGGALETALMGLNTAASVTVIARDLSISLGYETGKAMQTQAEAAGWGTRFHWLNEGMGMSGEPLENILTALKEAGADRVVYFNTVAAALSGLRPGLPPVFVKDYDAHGMFQWQLMPLTQKEIESTKFVMGTMAVDFPHVLEESGVTVEATVFADWRGSLDKASRDPALREYGRQGAYSTSLFLPKDILQAATARAYGTGRKVLDIFYPMMRTRALPFIPGGVMMSYLNETLLKKEGVRRQDIPELALAALDRVGKALTQGYDNPFPRLDAHDTPLDDWMYEVAVRLNNNEDSDYYYKRWV